MIRKIIKINTERCNGCGACAKACHEGAIQMVAGKAKLMRDDYCDGFGDCLPACPTGAITFEQREAAAYDEAAVLRAKATQGCPGMAAKAREPKPVKGEAVSSQLRQWPVQIKLTPIQAPWFQGADLLVAADCSAYAYGSFHQDFIQGHITLIGCPKLDGVDYSQKLAEILRSNEIHSVTVTRMEVPCCGGLELAVKNALEASGKHIPWRIVTIATDGTILRSVSG